MELGKGKQNVWCFHLNRVGDKWKKNYIQSYKKDKRLFIIIQAAIWDNDYSEITIMARDPNSK